MKLFTNLGKVIDKVINSTATVVIATTKTAVSEIKKQIPQRKEEKPNA